MNNGFWPDAFERVLHAVIASGAVGGIITAVDAWATTGDPVEWRHWLLVALTPVMSLVVSFAGSLIGDGSARLGTTHAVHPDGKGGRPMTHDEMDAQLAAQDPGHSS